jgi:hypothetical protein
MKKQTTSTPVFTVAEARRYFLLEMEHDNLEEPDFLSDTTLMKYKDCEVANKYLEKLHIRMQYAIALKRQSTSTYKPSTSFVLKSTTDRTS